MKVFITGATGYVGSLLVKTLVEHSHSITAFVRKNSNYFELEKSGVNICFGDITDKESIEWAAKKDIDVVLHLAFSLFPVSNARVNIDGVKNMIDVFRKRKIKRFIFISSALVYGHTDPKYT